MLNRNRTNRQFPLNIAGSSVFGRYPKISLEKTYNMLISDDFLVPYNGYQTAISASSFTSSLGGKGRGLHTSTQLGLMIGVLGNAVYTIDIFFDQSTDHAIDSNVTFVGTLETSTNPVYITENIAGVNNGQQIVISDGKNIYVYDPQNAHGHTFYVVTADGASPSVYALSFTPGFIDFHDTYVLAAARNDTGANSSGTVQNNTWRLSAINATTGMLYYPDYNSAPTTFSSFVGLIQTKPDETQAVVRFPSKGNVIFAMGSTVTEPWMDVGYQLFPYQRSTSFNIDYGCLSPLTIATNDEIVVWLGINEKTGPVIMYSDGGMAEKITTDGIDYLFSNLSKPSDSQAFLMRQDGHLIYHINFYTDNLSLFYDFNTKKFFHATDENGNYFIASSVAFFNNQYYFVTRNNGNVYAMDTIYTTYDGIEIPRTRVCRNVRLPTQEYQAITDVGFTIEQGTTLPQQQTLPNYPLWITQDGKNVITQGSSIFLTDQLGNVLGTQDGNALVAQQSDPTDFNYLEFNNKQVLVTYPRVDLSISIDGGYTFSSWMPYNMNPLGYIKNKIQWWQLGLANDLVCQFRFSGLGRFVATDGFVNARQ